MHHEARSHIPVLCEEVCQSLNIQAGGSFVDCTFGAGGYSRAFLMRGASSLWAIDQDPHAKTFALALEKNFPDRFTFIPGNFKDLDRLLPSNLNPQGIAFDLGVSSMQLDQGERGFSFLHDGPLDMRMNPTSGQTAADVVNTFSESDLADIIYHYGEERASRRIAKTIVHRRREARFESTLDLADVIEKTIGRHGKIHPATKSFQGLRIYVNGEFEAIQQGLTQAAFRLIPGGRLAVVTFHSLEDRLVKRHMKELCTQGFSAVTKKPVDPSVEEIKKNPRARSAKLRVIEKQAEGAH